MDSNSKIKDYKGEACHSPSIIDVDKYFIILALENRYEEIAALLTERGYQEEKDYIYYFNTNKVTVTQVNGYYCDNLGNEIIGNVKKCNIKIGGYGNLIVIHPDIQNLNCLDIQVKGNCTAYIEASEPSEAYKAQIFINPRASISIGRGTTFSRDAKFYIGSDMFVRVGNDCMFAAGVLVRCGAVHQLFYLDEEINVTQEEVETKMIALGDHVWIGQDAKLLTGAHIGSGSVVGMGAFVNKEFPENCSIVGVPARIGRRGVAWAREFRTDATAEDLEGFDFR